MTVPPDVYLNIAGSVLLVGLGLFVASVRPRRSTNVLFGAFASLFGMGFVFSNASRIGPEWTLLIVVTLTLWIVVSALLALFALRYPRPVEFAERRHLALPSALLVANAAPASILTAIAPERSALATFFGGTENLPGITAALGAGTYLLIGSAFFALSLWALRYRNLERQAPQEARAVALMSGAMLLYVGLVSGAGLVQGTGAFGLLVDQVFALLALASVVVVAALWLRNARDAEHPRIGRNVALLGPAVAFAGVVYSAWFAHVEFGAYGLVRTIMFLVWTYAILRGQLLGLDLKVRWTIKNSTIAAIFIAVFFVVSEAAQVFFAGTGLGEYAGIIAAGALVFAIAPLQGVAERVAQAAVPAGTPAASVTDARLERYKVALRCALRDRRITQEERIALAGLAEDLGIGAAAVEKARLEVEAEARAAPRQRPGGIR